MGQKRQMEKWGEGRNRKWVRSVKTVGHHATNEIGAQDAVPANNGAGGFNWNTPHIIGAKLPATQSRRHSRRRYPCHTEHNAEKEIVLFMCSKRCLINTARTASVMLIVILPNFPPRGFDRASKGHSINRRETTSDKRAITVEELMTTLHSVIYLYDVIPIWSTCGATEAPPTTGSEHPPLKLRLLQGRCGDNGGLASYPGRSEPEQSSCRTQRGRQIQTPKVGVQRARFVSARA